MKTALKEIYGGTMWTIKHELQVKSRDVSIIIIIIRICMELEY